eukprot:scaffold4280_cov385-Prasinococcus_capsulatus_cf.AAC.13
MGCPLRGGCATSAAGAQRRAAAGPKCGVAVAIAAQGPPRCQRHARTVGRRRFRRAGVAVRVTQPLGATSSAHICGADVAPGCAQGRSAGPPPVPRAAHWDVSSDRTGRQRERPHTRLSDAASSAPTFVPACGPRADAARVSRSDSTCEVFLSSLAGYYHGRC